MASKRVSWDIFKNIVTTRSLSIQFIEFPETYECQIFDGSFEIECSINKLHDDSSIVSDFETNFKSLGNVRLSKLDNMGRPLFVAADPTTDFNSIATYDFTKKQCWFQGSTRVLGESLTATANPLVFTSAHTYWIDLTHGLFTGEDKYAATYVPVIKVSGTVQTSGFTIDYVAGTVTFAVAPAATPTADYSYAGSSSFALIPAAGKTILLRKAEVQFSKDIQMVPIYFEIWAYNPNDLPNKVCMGSVMYKNEKDILNISNGGVYIPAFGTLTKDVMIFPFDYLVPIKVVGSWGMEIRVRTKDDAQFGGEYGTVTLYTQDGFE